MLRSLLVAVAVAGSAPTPAPTANPTHVSRLFLIIKVDMLLLPEDQPKLKMTFQGALAHTLNVPESYVSVTVENRASLQVSATVQVPDRRTRASMAAVVEDSSFTSQISGYFNFQGGSFDIRSDSMQVAYLPSNTPSPTAAPTASPTAALTAAPRAGPAAAPTAAPTKDQNNVVAGSVAGIIAGS